MATSNHRVSIVVGVNDLATSALRGIQSTVNSIGTGFNRAGTNIGAFTRNLDSVIGKMDSLANSMYKFNMYTSSLQRNLRNIGMVGGAIAGGIAVSGTNKAIDYDYKTRVMQSRMEVSNEVRKQISDYVLNELNLQVAYGPSQIADMGIILGQGGINNAKDMKSMMKTVSYFSEAVDAVPEQAAEMVIAAAKGFGISMDNSSQITDKLTVALNKSLLHVEEMPHAIGQLAGRANMYGQSFDSSLVALMTMRDQGMSAAQGSQDLLHALRSASKIGNDSVMYARTKSYFDGLGVTNAIFNQDTRQLKEFPDLIADMEKAMINQGFINPKYSKGITDDKSFREFLSKNGGVAPRDFWDSEKAMPLIAKVFGAAGTAPILMGLQSKYEEVNKETGEKTGNIYYGSDALKQMFKDVKNSDGAVNDTHAIIAESGKYSLEVLSGAWDAAQIKLLDGLVPLIKTGAEELTKFFMPSANGRGNKFGPQNEGQYDYKSPIERLRESLDKTVENFRKEGNTTTAEVVDTLGNGVLNGVEISKTFPSMGKQIGGAFNKNFVEADWGNNIIEFPWHIVKNGIKFISDIVKANKDFNDVVATLPENLQDPAKLVETLVKGGIVLLVTGAIVKTIELGVRGVSLALKGTKAATDLTTTIFNMITGKGKGGKGPGGLLGQNMAIKANIVNVYGGAINGKPGAPGGAPVVTPTGGAPGVPPVIPLATRLKNFGTGLLKYGAPTALIADMLSGANGGPSITKKIVQSEYNPLNNQTDKKIDEMHKILKDPSKAKIPKETEIVPESNFFKPKKVENAKVAPAMDTQALTNVKFPAIDSLNQKIDGFLGKLNKQTAEPLSKDTVLAFSKDIAANTEKTKFDLSSSIISGFNTANEKLQNVKLNNAVSVMVQPPQVNISGNIAEVAKVTSSGSSSFTTRESQNGTAWDRMQKLGQRRTGWR